MIDTVRTQRRPRRRSSSNPPEPGRPLQLHIFSFRFATERGFRPHATVLIQGRMNHTQAIGTAYAAATRRGSEPWLYDIRTVPAPRKTPRLDTICRKLTAFANFLDLLTAPAEYRPSIRLDLTGRDGKVLAIAYDATQCKWGDKRRAFITGNTPRTRPEPRHAALPGAHPST